MRTTRIEMQVAILKSQHEKNRSVNLSYVAKECVPLYVEGLRLTDGNDGHFAAIDSKL